MSRVWLRESEPSVRVCRTVSGRARARTLGEVAGTDPGLTRPHAGAVHDSTSPASHPSMCREVSRLGSDASPNQEEFTVLSSRGGNSVPSIGVDVFTYAKGFPGQYCLLCICTDVRTQKGNLREPTGWKGPQMCSLSQQVVSLPSPEPLKHRLVSGFIGIPGRWIDYDAL